MTVIRHDFPSKQPRRPHYIEAWAMSHGLSQADLARKLGADKSIVSRWYAGTTPGTEWQERIAALFGISAESIFRHPDDEWMQQFFKGRTPDEIAHIKQAMEITFPRRK